MPQKRFTRSNPAWLKRLRRVSLTNAAVLSGTVTALLVAAPLASAAPTAPPPVTVLTHSGPAGQGDIFITPTGDTSTYANGPEILSPSGNVVWFHPLPAGQTPRPTSAPRPTTASRCSPSGRDRARRPRQRHRLHLQRPLPADRHGQRRQRAQRRRPRVPDHPVEHGADPRLHEATANLTSIGGPADQTVINGVVQEIDIRTGKVLFQWNSADHVPYSQSEQPLPASASTPWDWFHINAVKLDTDGNLLIDARDTWTTYEVNRAHRQHHLAARRQGLQLHAPGRARPDAEQRRRDLRLAARPRGARPRHLHVLRQRVGGRVQPRHRRLLGAARSAARSPSSSTSAIARRR